MGSVPPPPDDVPRASACCPACRATTAGDQRYCLACGGLVGDRRLDPIEMLTPTASAGPLDGPPAGASPAGRPPSGGAAAPRTVPLAAATAATAAIVVAGISGMLMTNDGSGNGARAAVVAATTPASVAAETPAAADPEIDTAPVDEVKPDPSSVDEPLPADPFPAEPEEAPGEPIADDAPADDASTDEDTSEDEDAADEPAAESTPRVWLLALEGPHAAEAVDRIATQGVRLSGMEALATAAQANASALVGGTRPAAVTAAPVEPATRAPADPTAVRAPVASGAATTPAAPSDATADPAAEAPSTAESAPSLPAALVAAKRRWRAYVDVQPTGGPALPGACAAPAAGDPAATLLASRLPFAGIEMIDCETSLTSLEALGNDLSAGDDIPAFSYVAMGGCAAPERTTVALPDAVEDAVATITASTEFQQDGMLVVTTVGTQEACAPAASSVPADPLPASPAPVAAAPAVPVAPAATPIDPARAPVAAAPVIPAPTAVLRPAAKAGKTVRARLDLLALSRSMAEVLGVPPPGAAGSNAVPVIALPGVPKQTNATR